MLKYGLEKEYFLLKDGKPIVVSGFPADECGLLVEARGEPHYSITGAIFSLLSKDYELQTKAKKESLVLSDQPLMVIPHDVKLEAMRRFAKPLIKYENLYGHKAHKNSLREQTAGVHISFTSPQSYSYDNGKIYKYNTIFDFVQIFKKLDKAFAEEIKSAKRLPGFYELKTDGRIEYRSLPANVNLFKVIEILSG